MKKCSKCKEVKPFSEFYKNRRQRSGYRPECKQCASEQRQKYRTSDPKWKKDYWENYRHKARDSRLKTKYGITVEQYNEILEKQGGGCAVCGKTPEENKKALAVDHDHKTGEIFGLLCTYDNHRFIGRSRVWERYAKAAEYLKSGLGIYVPAAKKPKRKRTKRKSRRA